MHFHTISRAMGLLEVLIRPPQMCGTLLTDFNPTVSATVQASYNLVRCLCAAVGIAIQQPLDDAVGSGWCFDIYGIVFLLELPLGYVLLKNGQGWREKTP
ncbi:citrate exporter protein [Apiospora kogelbergensis]|uniref:Citrate exporter protein n=1 Tax=Apiospora kogelbergensis TaxID=1337665 RepID=A0AAW0RAI9_9PEZI